MNLNLMCLSPYLLVFLLGSYLIYILIYVSNILSMFREPFYIILANVFSKGDTAS